MEGTLRQIVSEKGEGSLGGYIRRFNAPVKGVAIQEPQPVAEREVRARVEFVYRDRNEAQVIISNSPAAVGRLRARKTRKGLRPSFLTAHQWNDFAGYWKTTCAPIRRCPAPRWRAEPPYRLSLRRPSGSPAPSTASLVDDTSRLARNVADALKLAETLSYHGVHMSFVSQGIDSQEKTARQLLTLHGMMDEQYLVGLAAKVHRGQEGRVLNRLHPGDRCYGYGNMPIEDPTRTGKDGRAAVSGVKLEINEEQAAVVRRIFAMYADGQGLARTAKLLNEEGVPAPQPPRTRTLRAWCPSSIQEMLRNERYRGVQGWNRAQKQRNPETGRKVSRGRPAADWRRVGVPSGALYPKNCGMPRTPESAW